MRCDSVMKRLTWAIALAAMPTLLLAAGADQKSKSAAPAKPMTDADLAAAKPGRDPESADRRGIHQEDQGVHDRAVLPLAARRLHAGVEGHPDAEGDARRHRRRARQAAVLERGLRVHAAAREVHAAREGLHDRHDRRRPRDDRGRRRVRRADGEARREQGRPREAGRPAHDSDERRDGRRDRASARRRSTTSPARFTRPKPARRRRSWSWRTGSRSTTARTSATSASTSSRSSRRSSKSTAAIASSTVRVPQEAPERRRARRDLLGPLRAARQQPRRDGADAQALAERARHLPRRTGRRRCCTTCTSRGRSSTTTRSATGRTTRGSIRS